MKKKDIFWGLFFILAAILIIVNQLGFLPEVSMVQVVISVLLIGVLIKSSIYLHFPGILFPLALLAIIYSDALNITIFSTWALLLTALLMSIGLSLIFKKHKFWEKHFSKGHYNTETIDQEDGNVVNCSVSFGTSIKYVNTEHFERANINCSFGSAMVYFDRAVMESDTAYIDLDVSFSGIELYIPTTWKVINEVNTTLGAFEEKYRSSAPNSPTVIIRGDVRLGAVEVIYV